jgi:L-alanine-DL-glutamate epimerase-like enolase superfamily enzyme
MAVPSGPGLGVNIDMEKLEHYADLHAADGDLVR